ncbi:hypothetical protein GOP47_0025663 [Adiantum capillus-veneris]|uniref:Transducin beta-like protein 2 n=1 Tax=Adiantum capillus-veneris TaxID=13818 RepID=A0A9D4U0Q9_ADICA|nr:hypothetical protein GOP47_0025663 [Adiantum capillus-veneris]
MENSLAFGILVAAFAGLVIAWLFTARRKAHSQQLPHDTPVVAGKLQQTPSKKPSSHSNKPRAADKGHSLQHHRLLLNTLKGHTDAINGFCFTSNGRGLATASGDGVARVFKLEDATSKNIKFLHLNLPSGNTPTAVAFGEGASQLVIATENISGASLFMYAAAGGKAAADAKGQGKLPPPDIKWEKHQVHDRKNIISLAAASASYGSGDGSIVIASCSEGTDIKLWLAADGKCVGTADTNQLKNNMATLSPDGRFLAAAAFTADVKIWELVYGKDGSIREVRKVMQLKGHKSAVTWLNFTWDSSGVITASKDGTIRVWNINVRYHLDEDPKCLKVLTIPLQNSKGVALHYDRLAVSPDNKTLAVTHGSILQWLDLDSGEVNESIDNAHDGFITGIAWSPQPLPTEKGRTIILATAGVDKKIKLWFPPC